MADLAYYLRMSNHLAGNLDIKSALRSVKSEIESLLPIDHLDVCLIDGKGYWNTSYEVGLRTSWSRTTALIEKSPVRDILVGATDIMITDNALEDKRYIFDGAVSEPILKHELRSRINVAMKVLGKTIGALNCSSKDIGIYNEKHIERVRNIADILAPYFYALRETEKAKKEAVMRTEVQAREEGLRRGAFSLTTALEQERQRIGMDLHDQTLADLTRIARDLDRSKTLSDVKAINVRMQDCIQGLRDIIDTSIPSLLELFGYQYAVRAHLESAIGSKSDITIDVTDQTGGKIDILDNTMRIALFRIAQEAINNAVRHAHATRIDVTISEQDGRLVVIIRDDGVGGATSSKPSGGLMHMGTRARLIGASFEIQNDHGTSVCVQLSLNAIQEGSRHEDITG